MESNNIFKIVSVVSLLAVAFLWIGGGNKQASQGITVGVEGAAMVAPSSVSMIVTRVGSGSNTTTLIEDGEVGMKKLIEVAKRVGGADVEIKRNFYQMTPQENGTYLIVNAFSVKSKKVTEANNLVRELYNNGATTVSGVAFEPKDKEAAEQEARTDALKTAKQKAEKTAKAAGGRLGRVISIVDESPEVSTTVSDANQTEIRISKKLTVVYEIK